MNVVTGSWFMVKRDARQDSGLKAICSSHRLKCTSVLKANMSSLGSAEASVRLDPGQATQTPGHGSRDLADPGSG